MTGDKINLFRLNFDVLTMRQSVDTILTWCGQPQPRARMVVTPNLHAAVMANNSAEIEFLWNAADLSLVDGMPIVWASRLFGKYLPERVAGSDLVPELFKAAASGNKPLRIFLLGAEEGVAEVAAAKIMMKGPGCNVVGFYSPPLGFEDDVTEQKKILRNIADAAPDLLLVGLGAPKQELWASKWQSQLPVKVIICGGATIDFLAERIARAPRWMRRCGLEWSYRLAREPLRLGPRYLKDALMLPLLVFAEAGRPRRRLPHAFEP